MRIIFTNILKLKWWVCCWVYCVNHNPCNDRIPKYQIRVSWGLKGKMLWARKVMLFLNGSSRRNKMLAYKLTWKFWMMETHIPRIVNDRSDIICWTRRLGIKYRTCPGGEDRDSEWWMPAALRIRTQMTSNVNARARWQAGGVGHWTTSSTDYGDKVKCMPFACSFLYILLGKSIHSCTCSLQKLVQLQILVDWIISVP